MSLYYVFMKWRRDTDSRCSVWARMLLTCESRYVADDLFRALQTVKFPDGRLRFTHLTRNTPQFWCYDTIGDPWKVVADVLGSVLLASFGSTVMPLLLTDGGGRDWSIAPTVEGPDWVHNGTYFIRNKRQPNLYWYHSKGEINVSERQKTKFRIVRKAFGADKQAVIIGSDTVEIFPIESGNANCRSTIQYVSIGDNESNKLLVSGVPKSWTFSEFRGRFGTIWEQKADSIQELVTWSNLENNDGDHWELC